MASRTIKTELHKIKSGSESEDVKIATLTSIGELGVESDEIDITTHDSADGYKEFMAGDKDSGEVIFEGLISDEEQIEYMLALAQAQTNESWYVKYPSGAEWHFDGFLKAFKDGAKDVSGVASFSGTIRISGATSFDKASA